LSREIFVARHQHFSTHSRSNTMKNFTIKAFVLTLAIAGAVATSVSSAATSHKHATVVTLTDPSGPAPLCLPNSGNTCGLD
jgi:hypothetical protein